MMSKLIRFLLLFTYYYYKEFLNRVGSRLLLFAIYSYQLYFFGVKVWGCLQTICQMGYSFATTIVEKVYNWLQRCKNII